MTPDRYRSFIREAYIAPLRSVLIVDDDYPTLEETLAPIPIPDREKQRALGQGKLWWTEPKDIQKVISRFRKSKPALIVDVHDGKNLEQEADAEVAAHLHQSDLLILDYSLDKTNRGNGDRALQILRKVLESEQYNLVVLHTSEVLNDVFPKALQALLAPAGPFLSEEEKDEVLETIASAEDDDPHVLAKIEGALSSAHYLFFRQSGDDWPKTPPQGAPPRDGFDAAAVQAGFTDDRLRTLLLNYALGRLEERLASGMLSSPLPNLTWSSADPKWIRCDNGFVAFSSKPHKADLIQELIGALVHSKPDPSRLFLAKIRSEIDRQGVTAAAKALGNRYVLAHWYERLLSATSMEQKFQISESIARHSDLLMTDILSPVSRFAKRIVEADSAEPSAKLCVAYFGVDLADKNEKLKSYREHNAFVCSKEIEGHHLATGHLFQAGDKTWVCMTPLCDLTPDRISPDRHGATGGRMPFVALRLESDKIDPKKVRATSGRYIFARLNGETKIFAITKEDPGANPVWFNFYAEDGGRFGHGRSLRLSRPEANAKGEWTMKMFRAQIVGQLRYEYALNVLQRLGGAMTRVGLDFV